MVLKAVAPFTFFKSFAGAIYGVFPTSVVAQFVR